MSNISSDVFAVGRVKPDNISSSFLVRLFGATFWVFCGVYQLGVVVFA